MSLSVISTHIANMFSNQNSLNAKTLLTTLGAGLALYKAFSLTQNIFSNQTSNNDLATRYGKNTWALITNAIDEAGKEFALELAGKGFNLILLGSDLKQLKNFEQKLVAKYPETQTKTIVSDFVNAYTKGFAKLIYKQVQNLDISILVNNVGSGKRRHEKISTSELKNKLEINSLAHVLLTKTFLPKLGARSQKSCIINVASFASSFSQASLQPSASEVFDKYFSSNLVEQHPNVDVLSLKPTKMSINMIEKKRLSETLCLSPEECVRPALENLEKADESLDEEEIQDSL